jgi:hypothetical protein
LNTTTPRADLTDVSAFEAVVDLVELVGRGEHELIELEPPST